MAVAVTVKPLLLIFGGLPGTGKTSICKLLAVRLRAVYLRIDTIEQALLRENALGIGHEGYMAAYALAQDNLQAGNTVIADAVNATEITRAAWRKVAENTGVHFVEIEIICSDKATHQRRVEERVPDIEGHNLPTWSDVLQREYQPWESKAIQIDTAHHSADQAADTIISYLDGLFLEPL